MKRFILDESYNSDLMLDWRDTAGNTSGNYNELVGWVVDELGLELESLGTSQDGGYTLYGTETGDKTKPTILIIANQHGWERGGSHYGSEFMRRMKEGDFLTNNYNLLKSHFHFYFLLSANPWGYERGIRENSRGIDLNRNWDFNFSEHGEGDFPFSESETQIMRDLIIEKDPAAIVDIHQWGGGDKMGFALGEKGLNPLLLNDFSNTLKISNEIPIHLWSANDYSTLTAWARERKNSLGKNIFGLLMETKNSDWDNQDSQEIKTIYAINSMLIFCLYVLNNQRKNTVILN